MVVAAASILVCLLLIVYTAYFFVWIPFIAAIICLICLVLLAIAVIFKKQRQFTSLLLALVAFVATSAALLVGGGALRSSLRWLLWSGHFKAKVLAQPVPATGELRHMEWEATGFAGVANNTVYLVFDPTDSLSAAAKSHSPGKFKGVPCKVPLVRRLESHWYAVWFYTDEAWGECSATT